MVSGYETSAVNLQSWSIVTASNGHLCQNFIALEFSRKWRDARAGNPLEKYLALELSTLKAPDVPRPSTF